MRKCALNYYRLGNIYQVQASLYIKTPSRWLPDVPQKFIILKRIASFKYFLFLFKGF